jgi:hypothetical protein
MAAPAYATNTATLNSSATSVHQGGSFYLQTKCSDPQSYALLTSKLFVTPIMVLTAGGKPGVVQINVSATKKPQKYSIKLTCQRSPGGHIRGAATVVVQVLHRKKPIPHPSPSPFGPATIVVNTGFGGLAARVTAHHPAR